MDTKTQGAWLIHHCNKLQSVQNSTGQYEQINFAGKCGILLSSMAASDEIVISKKRINALSKAAGISTRLELPTILKELEKQKLIDQTKHGLCILGLSTQETLKHTATIFKESSPDNTELASISVAEAASEAPISEKKIKDELSDTYQLPISLTKTAFSQYADIGFVDSQKVGGENILFNGNLFRKENIKKINGVLASLSSSEEIQIKNLLNTLDSAGCIPLQEAVSLTSEELLNKLVAIAFIDINTVGNEYGQHSFVTRPTAFKKYSNAAIEDAFDLAKAFVTSLTYGMIQSYSGRGRITMIEALMRKLINGYWVGPATAIGKDYKILEMKGVIQVKPDKGLYSMKLLKKDVGEIAYKVITEGEASSSIITQLPSVSATSFRGPEVNRTITRKRQTSTVANGVATLLNDLRTGGIR